ncbi:pyridoxine/pyridoxamine 5'-phosphate oxidase [Neiella marina]|uniref:Pyridoxine/pyridoxamine 5'-phosphate oxidase n=1 Tax=Neiella marina TaxID=508461 RepID=A0A8J2XPS8_9GAMM|nr:pyridoxamine 5'-phosphate oxidase [Neiella marina]GGA79481.1 pyridoxine/pyridoxamine 5'-phosphate oxidase [Neiella marina]
MLDLSDLRREYTQGGLRREQLPASPFELFEKWLRQAVDAKLSDPTAMSIATVDEGGQPFQRIVLLKQSDPSGFVFFTNLGSRKAQHIKGNNQVSALFPWHPLERQVHITGQAQPLSHGEVLRYFMSRPKESQIAAWASKQSARLSARQLLEAKYMELKKKFSDGEVPLPTFWGGFRIVPSSIEFWQGGEHRLHDRFLYQRQTQDDWTIERLAP